MQSKKASKLLELSKFLKLFNKLIDVIVKIFKKKLSLYKSHHK